MPMPPKPTHKGEQNRRFEALDLLRLFAVGAVVLFHYGFRGAMGNDHLSSVWLPSLAGVAIYGYLGVKLFFVISGFVISFSAQNRSAPQFAAARFCRIYPAFIVCMTVTFLVTLALGGTIFQASFAKWIANATFVIPAKSLQYAMDGAYWSIYAEIIFYGWIALLIKAGWFARNLTAAVTIWLFISALNQVLFHSILLEKLFLTNQSGFFAAGIMLFVLLERRRNWENILVLGLAAELASLQAMNETPYFIEFVNAPLNIATVGILSFACIGIVAAATCVKRVPLPSTLVMALGGITYPLYLLHQNIGYMLFNTFGAWLPAGVLVALVTCLMAATAFVTWRYIEPPGQRLMRRLLAVVGPMIAPAISRVRLRGPRQLQT